MAVRQRDKNELFTRMRGLLLCWTLCMIVEKFMRATGAPEQVSLQISQDMNGLCVFWITTNRTATNGVRYGTAPGMLNETQWSRDQARYEFRRRGYTSEWLHKVYLKGLRYNTLYYYRAGDWLDGWSSVHWFHTRPKPSEASTVSLAVLADQNVNMHSGMVLDSLLQQQSRFNYHALLHAGDISYADGNQTVWDEYGRWWSAFSAYHPVAYAVGDKDVEGGGTKAYQARMRNGLGIAGQRWDWQKHWYSFIFGSVRVIFLSSEHANDESQIMEQTSWLNRTLQDADRPSQRKLVPWIIVVIHRPLHNSPPGEGSDGPISERLKRGIEVLFREYRVNVVVTGHCHNYERTYPMYNETITQLSRGWVGTPYEMRVYAPKAPWLIKRWGIMYTTVGTGGSPVEDLGRHPPELERPCIVRHTNGNEDENYIVREHDCSNGCWSQEWSTYVNAEKGFGVFEANHTMLYFQYFSAEQHQVIDEAVICALPGCEPPTHIPTASRPGGWQAPTSMLGAPPMPAAPPSVRQQQIPSTLDSFYPDDVQQEETYDPTMSPMGVKFVSSSQDAFVTPDAAVTNPSQEVVHDAKGTDNAIWQGEDGGQEPGDFEYIPISQVKDNLSNSGPLASSLEGVLEQESAGKGTNIYNDFGPKASQESGSREEGPVAEDNQESSTVKHVEIVHGANESGTAVSQNGGSLPVGLILAVSALCCAALLGIIVLTGLLVLRGRASGRSSQAHADHGMHTVQHQRDGIHSLGDAPCYESTSGSVASRLSWSAGEMLSPVLETPPMHALREKHSLGPLHPVAGAPGGADLSGGAQCGVIHLRGAPVGGSGTDCCPLEPSLEEEELANHNPENHNKSQHAGALHSRQN